MSREQKPVVDITNRPSGRDSHTSREWVQHLHLREDEETRRDIRTVRAKLSRLTVRGFAETFCYDDPVVRDYILEQLDPDQLIGDVEVDERALRKLAARVGGAKTAAVMASSKVRKAPQKAPSKPPENQQTERQVELLRELLKTMDPSVVKRALLGD